MEKQKRGVNFGFPQTVKLGLNINRDFLITIDKITNQLIVKKSFFQSEFLRFYSYLRLSTGLARAVFMVWKINVNVAMSIVTDPAKTNTIQPMFVL